MNPRRTPLYQVHVEAGARMVEFAGWEMPVQYAGALEEHHAVRRRVGMFDVSHMGRLELRGEDALAFAQRMTCNDVFRLADGQAQYSAFLTPEGTFVDDIVVYRFGPQRIFICVNAATCAKDLAWLQQHRQGRVEVLDRSSEFAQIAVQGPLAEQVVQRLTQVDLSTIKFYWFVEGRVAGAPTLISRTGYTGEKGFELYVAAEQAEPLWTALMEAGRPEGIAPAGLAARNTLRLEMRYPLYGNDIDEHHTPLEAGLGWIVKLGTGFIGEEALRRQAEEGPAIRLCGFELTEPGIVRDGCPVHLDGREVGRVTSGGYAPSLEKSIGLVYLPADRTATGTPLTVDIRGKMRRAKVVETPFYRKPK